jgi:membrane protease subunit (stomatin/prohibitin family)
MSKESLGYVKLEWVCPKCSSRNPGPEKTCLSCGAPQPENVQFQQAEQQELIKDQEEVDQAKSGPDIHCAFCGTRNLAGAKICTQCGADLSQGVRRQAGQVVGAFQAGPARQVTCPSCGSMNPENALKCAQCGAVLAPKPTPASQPAAPPRKVNPLWIGLGIAAVLLCLCAIVVPMILASRTEAQTGVVESVQWISSIDIEALQPVSLQGWMDEIPSDATVGTCENQVRRVQDEPAPNSNKVCGTPYTVDKGSGFAEVVQDCQYEVLEPYCKYTVLDWQRVAVATMQGADFSPAWPQPQIGSDQQLGNQQQIYRVVFQSIDEQYAYTPATLSEFQQFEIGSEWMLNINSFGDVVSVEPK